MLPKTHIIVGIIVSLIIFIFWPSAGLFNISIIFLSSILTDFDHYLYFIWTKKDFSLVHAYRWFVRNRKFTASIPFSQRRKYKLPVMIFHGIEFWIFLLVLSFMNKIFIWVLVGTIAHMFVDFTELITLNIPLYTKISQIYVYIQNKGKKQLPITIS